MGLNNTNIETLFETIESTLLNNSIFKDYVLFNTNTHKTKSPTLITYYDLEFKNASKNMWLFFRIEDYLKNQKIIFWLNKLDNRSPINFDIEKYLVGKLNLNKAKQEFISNLNTVSELQQVLDKVLLFLETLSDNKLTDILQGKDWIELDFDWHNYK